MASHGLFASFRFREEKKLEKELEEIEKHKNDSNRCYAAIRNLQNRQPQKPLCVKDKE